MLNHVWETLTFYHKLPSNLSQEAEFLVAERDDVTLLHKPGFVQTLGREGPRLPVITVVGRHSFCQLSTPGSSIKHHPPFSFGDTPHLTCSSYGINSPQALSKALGVDP